MKIELRASNGETRSHTGLYPSCNDATQWSIAAAKVNDTSAGFQFAASNIVPNAVSIYGIDGTVAASANATGECTLNWPAIEALAKSPTAHHTSVMLARLLLAARTHGVTQ